MALAVQPRLLQPELLLPDYLGLPPIPAMLLFVPQLQQKPLPRLQLRKTPQLQLPAGWMTQSLLLASQTWAPINPMQMLLLLVVVLRFAEPGRQHPQGSSRAPLEHTPTISVQALVQELAWLLLLLF
jgi:hypothetical protein